MVLNQILTLTRNIPLCTLKSPLTHTPLASLSSVRLFSSPTTRLGFNLLLKSSNDYNNHNGSYDQFVGPQYPKPSEIEWKKELCNSVQLIGIVATPVQIKHLNSGKVLAWSSLAVKKSATDTSWINLTFWDELAHVAFEHVEKGQQIYISGRLVTDTVENDDGKQQTYYKVVVQKLNFVERNFSSAVALYDGDSNSVTPGRTLSKYAPNSTGTTEELWQAFFANPLDWWDNRNTKRNPKYPDFKHKDTKEALWVEGRNNPQWVKSQLAILDAKVESFHAQIGEMNEKMMAIDDYVPF
ncbi:protein OSB4, chloroplastic-like [Cornus florida]|uniref:protein OSB4, chloroplastic-like n=1 Tax=Cornus florida TaxID=4283 RepID=UPI00289D2D7A|nr:protein OSB4, chloroplastic-like [Cornus florida]